MLTDAELAVLHQLAEAYNAFGALPRSASHPSDADEFAAAIHTAQHIVMIRSAVRAHPDVFVTIGGGVTDPGVGERACS